jgi:Domain of unknown function (DUF4262)
MSRESNEFEQNMIHNIEKYGCSINHILDDEVTGDLAFSYSIGLFATFQQPEILVIGLKQELRHDLINNICFDYKESKTLKIGAYSSDILDGFDCLVLEVDKVHYKGYLGSANWYYKEKDFSVIQIIYPTLKGIYPWEKDFTSEINYPILNKNYKDFI